MNQPEVDRNEETRLCGLAAAQMLQALADFYLGSPRQRESVLAWLAGKTEDGLPFELCCNLLHRDTDHAGPGVQADYRQAFSIGALAMMTDQERGFGPDIVNVSGGE